MGYLIEIAFTVLLLTALSDGQLQVVPTCGCHASVCRKRLPKYPTSIGSAASSRKPTQAYASQATRALQTLGLVDACGGLPCVWSRFGDLRSSCTMKNTEHRAGVCTPFANCQSAKDASYKGNLPQKCDLIDDDSELVCCVAATCSPLLEGLVNQLPIGSRAADYCIELAQKIHPCQETDSGWTRGNICHNLTPESNIEYKRTPMATMAEAPHYGRFGQGQIGAISWANYPVNLVSDQWVVCSAWAIGSIQVLFVGLGGTFEPKYTPDETYGVTERRIHPLYNGSYSVYYNDIALLRLDRRVTFTTRILPACLHTGTPLPDSGFIQSDSAGLKTTMQRPSQEECSNLFTNHHGHPDGVLNDMEICSLPVNTTGECAGWYQGSPLTLPNSLRVACTHLLVGYKSYYIGSPCAVINTRISKFIPWIEDIVWPVSGGVVV